MWLLDLSTFGDKDKEALPLLFTPVLTPPIPWEGPVILYSATFYTNFFSQMVVYILRPRSYGINCVQVISEAHECNFLFRFQAHEARLLI